MDTFTYILQINGYIWIPSPLMFYFTFILFLYQSKDNSKNGHINGFIAIFLDLKKKRLFQRSFSIFSNSGFRPVSLLVTK